MDFWAQHKDFVLKVLAGAGVFLVALIARGIVYGDELESEQSRNRRLHGEIARLKLLPVRQIEALERQAGDLQGIVERMSEDVGWRADEPDLERKLVERIVSWLPRNDGASPDEIRLEAQAALDALRSDLSGGFGQLRLAVRDDLLETAGRLGIRIEGIGFEAVVQLEAQELLKYLLQLELTARVLSEALEARVDEIESVAIETRDLEAIPGVNPEFLREYAVAFRIHASQEAANRVLNRLEEGAPTPPWRSLLIRRKERPRDHVAMELVVTAVAVSPEAPLAQVGQEEAQ